MRPLLKEGKQTSRQLFSKYFNMLDQPPTHYISSDFLRARQTAALARKAHKKSFQKAPKLIESKEFRPNCSPEQMSKALQNLIKPTKYDGQDPATSRVFVFGHEPSLSKWCRALLNIGRSAPRGLQEFKKSQIVILECNPQLANCELVGVLSPKLFTESKTDKKRKKRKNSP